MARTSRTARPRRAGRQETTGAARRSRLMLLGALVAAAIFLFAWFPAGSLLSQRSSLTAAAQQLATLHAQDAALAQEQKNLSDSSEIGRVAREQYQLVSPGQQAYEVLPPTGSAAARTPYAGDPGTADPVAPSATSELPPGAVTTTTTPADAHGKRAVAPAPVDPGFFSRVLHSLEFWR